jgi:hypothetical protein
MRHLPIPELSRAILIGASEFDGLPELPAVQNNLTDLHAVLTNKDTGILPPDRCTIIRNPGSTAAFMTELRRAAKQAEDFFLVYYAGHGVRDPIHNDRLYLAVRETDGEEPDGTAVGFESVRNVIEASRTHTRVLILDCCYSGLAAGVMSGPALDVQEIAVDGTAVLTSAPKNKRSLSPPGERYTAFTGELITLLRRGSRVPGEPLTVDAAFRSLQVVLNARNLPPPKLRTTETSGDILLRRSPPLIRPMQAPRPIRRPVRIAPESRTVPVMTPVTAPAPPPPPVLTSPPASISTPPPPDRSRRSRPRWPRLVQPLMADSGWLLILIGFALGIASIVGGFSAAIAESRTAPTFAGNDRALAGSGSLLFVVCGALIASRIIRARKNSHHRPSLRELSPTLEARLSKARPLLLICGLVASVAIGLGGALSPLSPNTDPTSFSSLATTISVLILLGQVAAACAYGLYRRRRTTPVADLAYGEGTPPAMP